MHNETVGVSYGDLNYKSVNQWTTFHIVYLGGLCFPFSLFVFTHFSVYVLTYCWVTSTDKKSHR